jgi:methyl-accepting chemotaxis protein
MKKQSAKLMEMIDAAVGLLDRPADLVPVLVDLGEGHTKYGTEEAHYPVVGKALIATLHKGIGKAMTAEVEAAWVRTYGTIQGAMLQGAASDKGKRQLADYKDAQGPARSADEYVMACWAATGGDLDELAIDFFLAGFALDYKCFSVLFHERDMFEQSQAIVSAFASALELLGDRAALGSVFVDMGAQLCRTAGWGGKELRALAPVLSAALCDAAGAAVTTKMRAAVDALLAGVSGAMLQGAATPAAVKGRAAYLAANPAPAETDGVVLQASWASVKAGGDLAGFGRLFFASLFQLDGALQVTVFNGVSVDADAQTFVDAIDACIGVVDADSARAATTRAKFGAIGATFKARGMEGDHYACFAKAFIAALHTGLGARMTPRATEAWVRWFAIAETLMRSATPPPVDALLAEVPAAAAPAAAEPVARSLPAAAAPQAAAVSQASAQSETASDNEHVRASWALVAAGDITAVGEIFYETLFDLDAVLLETVFHGTDVRKQATKLMQMIGSAVGLLDRPADLGTVLVELGETHTKYGVEHFHYPVVGQALLLTLHKGLGEAMTRFVEAAWTRTYAAIQGAMLQGAASETGIRQLAAYKAKHVDRMEVGNVQRSWALVAAGGDLAGVGQLFYRTLFEQDDTLIDTVFKNVDMKKQSAKLMQMIDTAVGMLDAPQDLIPVLAQLGMGHTKYGVEDFHYPVVGQALIETLRKGLGAQFTPAVEASWARTYRTIQGAMVHGALTSKGVAQLAAYKKANHIKTDAVLVEDSWLIIKSSEKVVGQFTQFGKIFYECLFKADDTLAETLFVNSDMAVQAVKLMKMIDTVVGIIDTPSFIPAVLELGEGHTRYGVDNTHYPIVGRALLAALQVALPAAAWTAATKQAWMHVYGAIQAVAVRGAASPKGAAQLAAYKRAHMRSDATLVKQSWNAVVSTTDAAAVGALFYRMLFKIQPDLERTLFAAVDMEEQGKKLVSVMELVVAVSDDYEKVRASVVALGENHTRYGVEARHYPMVGAALTATLHEALGASFTPEAEAAWVRVYGQIQAGMVDAASSTRGRRQLAEYNAKHSTATSDVDLVRQTWAIIAASGDLTPVGSLFFMTLFAEDPALKATLFKGVDMKRQSVLIMETLQAAVGLLDRPHDLTAVLVSLGEGHTKYGVSGKHFPVVKQALYATIKNSVGSCMTPACADAWQRTIALMLDTMERATLSEKAQGRLRSYSAGHASEASRDGALVQATWAKVTKDGRELAAVGELFYRTLFGQDVTLEATVFKGVDMKRQAIALMQGITAAVTLVGEPQKLNDVLTALGEAHAKYGVEEPHFKIVGRALIATLRQGLGAALTPEAEEAWVRTYGVMRDSMARGLLSDKAKTAQYAYRQQHANDARPDVVVVQGSWADVMADFDKQTVGDLFYKTLFAMDRALIRTIFRGFDVARQATKLIDGLSTAIGLLRCPADLAAVLEPLGEGHCRFGVEARHYPVVGQALIATLRTGLGGEFTDDVEAAWGRTYGAMSAAMLRGAQSARGQQWLAEYLATRKESGQSSAEHIATTWQQVVEEGFDTVGALVFSSLLKRLSAEEGKMFASVNMDAQAVKLMKMLDVAIRFVDSPVGTKEGFADLGLRHRRYGVTGAHYDALAAALMEVLAKVCAGSWPVEAANAWQALLAQVVGAMRAAEGAHRRGSVMPTGTAAVFSIAGLDPVDDVISKGLTVGAGAANAALLCLQTMTGKAQRLGAWYARTFIREAGLPLRPASINLALGMLALAARLVEAFDEVAETKVRGLMRDFDAACGYSLLDSSAVTIAAAVAAMKAAYKAVLRAAAFSGSEELAFRIVESVLVAMDEVRGNADQYHRKNEFNAFLAAARPAMNTAAFVKEIRLLRASPYEVVTDVNMVDALGTAAVINGIMSNLGNWTVEAQLAHVFLEHLQLLDVQLLDGNGIVRLLLSCVFTNDGRQFKERPRAALSAIFAIFNSACKLATQAYRFPFYGLCAAASIAPVLSAEASSGNAIAALHRKVFELQPDLSGVFLPVKDLNVTRQTLLASLGRFADVMADVNIVEHDTTPPPLARMTAELAALGTSHAVKYKIRPSHYRAMLTALVGTLRADTYVDRNGASMNASMRIGTSMTLSSGITVDGPSLMFASLPSAAALEGDVIAFACDLRKMMLLSDEACAGQNATAVEHNASYVKAVLMLQGVVRRWSARRKLRAKKGGHSIDGMSLDALVEFMDRDDDEPSDDDAAEPDALPVQETRLFVLLWSGSAMDEKCKYVRHGLTKAEGTELSVMEVATFIDGVVERLDAPAAQHAAACEAADAHLRAAHGGPDILADRAAWAAFSRLFTAQVLKKHNNLNFQMAILSVFGFVMDALKA